jgi:uncharacterized membrane protein
MTGAAIIMATCPSCGGALVDGVCRRCVAQGTSRPESPAISDNVASALCYLLLGITGALLLFLEPYCNNRRVRFHAFQAIFVNLALIVVWLGISLLGKSLALLLSPLFLLGVLVLWLVLIWTTLQNGRIVLPVIGPIAEKQA